MTYHCRTCVHYREYYHQNSGYYQRLNYGFCYKHLRVQKHNEDSCELYKSNSQKNKRFRIELTEALHNSLENISDIASIFNDLQKNE